MKAAIVIPARYASTRLAGKLLLEVGGKSILQHTYERARLAKNAETVLIAADDERIAAAARAFGAEVVITDPGHQSGTERAAEAARGLQADIVVNLQGDEPEIDPENIDALIAAQAAHAPFASTLACRFPADASLDDPSAVKAVLGRRVDKGESPAADIFEALYFTRALAPYPRDGAPERSNYFLHIGVYAFAKDALERFAAAPRGRLEKIEQLEQLRILELGERMLCVVVDHAAPGIDTAEDLAAFAKRIDGRG